MVNLHDPNLFGGSHSFLSSDLRIVIPILLPYNPIPLISKTPGNHGGCIASDSHIFGTIEWWCLILGGQHQPTGNIVTHPQQDRTTFLSRGCIWFLIITYCYFFPGVPLFYVFYLFWVCKETNPQINQSPGHIFTTARYPGDERVVAAALRWDPSRWVCFWWSQRP